MDKLKKLLKSILGTDPTETQIQKAQAMPPAEVDSLTGALVVLEKYQEELPEDLEEATATIVKAALTEAPQPADEKIDVEKIGAKLSKATKDELVKIKAIVDKMLQADTEKAEKYAGLPEDVRKRLEAMDEQERLAKAEKARAGEAKIAELEKMVKEQAARIEKMESRRVTVSKQAKVDEGEDEDGVEKKEDKPLWPSLSGRVFAARDGE
jgi:copper chaperone CopZ